MLKAAIRRLSNPLRLLHTLSHRPLRLERIAPRGSFRSSPVRFISESHFSSIIAEVRSLLGVDCKMAIAPMILPSPLPDLPIIPSDRIRTQVFAHSTSLTFTGAASDQPQSNERLEFLGDSYLNFCVAQAIYTAFPTFTPGELSELRSGIVSNTNLNFWARAYGLQNHLVLGVSMAPLQIAEKSEKIIADVFEAYIGGVITSNPNGRALAEQFINILVRPTLEQHKAMVDSTVKLDMQAASKLHQFAFQAGRTAQYEFVESGPMGAVDRWEAVCLLDMVEAGRAKGRNHQEAKQRVAGYVLEGLRQ